MTYKMTSRDKLGAFATKNPKYKEYLLQSNNQMEKGNSFLSHLLFKNFVKLSFVSCYYQYIYIYIYSCFCLTNSLLHSCNSYHRGIYGATGWIWNRS